MRATLPRRARSMLPWALDRLVPMAAALLARCPARAGHFAWRPEPRWRPPTRTSREGRVFRPCLAPCDRRWAVPEGTIRARSRWLRRLPKEPPRPQPRRASTWMPVDLPREEVPPRRSPHPKVRVADVIATHLRRDSSRPGARSEERRPVVRARARHPSAVTRVRDAETARRTRSRPEACSSARHSRAPRRVLRRAPPQPSRRSVAWGRAVDSPGGAPLAARGSGSSPASWRAGSGQTVIVFTGTDETRSEDEVSPPIRRSV
jgi:hypothetical protein